MTFIFKIFPLKMLFLIIAMLFGSVPIAYALDLIDDIVGNQPEYVLADEAGQRLFLAYPEQHQIVISDLNGIVLATIGSGQEGHADGVISSAQFSHPRGMAYVDPNLYLADYGNHMIRRIDLKEGTVSTIAGTGQVSSQRNVYGFAGTMALNGPADLAVYNNKLYIAMAGAHQIWVLDLILNSISVFAGSGNKMLVDGSLRRSSFIAPWRLALEGDELYVIDAKHLWPRKVGLNNGGQVRSVGQKGDFHRFSSSANGRYYVTRRNEDRISVIGKDGVLIERFPIRFSEEAEPEFVFDFENFFGERIALSDVRSPWIGDIHLNLTFPQHYKLLSEAKPLVNVFTTENLIYKAIIEGETNVFPIGLKVLNADEVFVEVKLYYCKEGQEGLCLIKNILFEIPLNPGMSNQISVKGDIVLDYVVPEES